MTILHEPLTNEMEVKVFCPKCANNQPEYFGKVCLECGYYPMYKGMTSGADGSKIVECK